MSYEVLKNRLTNGTAFLLQTALDRINALADALEITQEQADELTALAKSKGQDILPDDLPARMEMLEDAAKRFNAFWDAAKDNPVLKAIISLVESKIDEETESE